MINEPHLPLSMFVDMPVVWGLGKTSLRGAWLESFSAVPFLDLCCRALASLLARLCRTYQQGIALSCWYVVCLFGRNVLWVGYLLERE